MLIHSNSRTLWKNYSCFWITMQLSRYIYMSTEYIRGFLFLLVFSMAPILMRRWWLQVLSGIFVMFQHLIIACFRFILKNWFNDLTISSKQGGFLHFQLSSRTVLHAHFITIIVFVLFHVFQHCNVTLLVLLFLLTISSWPKVKPYRLDSVMAENRARAPCFISFSFAVVVILFT